MVASLAEAAGVEKDGRTQEPPLTGRMSCRNLDLRRVSWPRLVCRADRAVRCGMVPVPGRALGAWEARRRGGAAGATGAAGLVRGPKGMVRFGGLAVDG